VHQQQQQMVQLPQQTNTAQPQPPAPRKPFPWLRSIILAAVGIVLIIVYFLPLVIPSLPALKSFSNTLIPLLGAIGAFIVAIVPVIQYLFALSSDAPASPAIKPTPPDDQTPPDNHRSSTPPAPPPQGTFFYPDLALPDPEDFFGRASERNTLITRTLNGGSTAIAGPRRIGKTWLIKYVQHVAPTQFGLNYRIGIVTVAHDETLASFTRKAIQALNISTIPLAPTNLPLDMLKAALQDLQARGNIAVLCIDRFDRLIGKPGFDRDFIDSLRTRVEEGSLLLIIASEKTLGEVIQQMISDTSPLIVQQLTLHPFTEQEAQAFVKTKGQQSGFNAEEQAFLLECATVTKAGNAREWPPRLLQLAGQLLLADKRAAFDDQRPFNVQSPVYQADFKRRLSEQYQTG
jgi:hypothetical protein